MPGRQTISDFLKTCVTRGDVPCVVASVATAGDLLYLEAFGKSAVGSNIDATPDTIFRLASMTKPVTSLPAMMLVDVLLATNRSLARPFPLGARKDKFGFGFQIETQPSDPEMRSPGSLSWAGIFNTYFWIDPLKELAAVVMMQLLPGNDEKAVDLFRGFERLVYAG